MRKLAVLAALALGLYLAAVGALYAFQRSLMYPADPSPVDAAAAGVPGLGAVTLETADGERLAAWSVPASEGRPSILYFHGNGGNLERPGRLARFRALTAAGYGLLAVSYRGYGGSTGTPSEDGLARDAEAAYAALAARVPPENIVLYGESLGTGVAIRLATERPVAALVLEAPYLSTRAVAELRYPFAPVGALMKDQFRSDLRIVRVSAPVLVLHGERDAVVPFAQGQALFRLANEPKRFVRFPAGSHENLPSLGSIEEIDAFLEEVAAGTFTGSRPSRRAQGPGD